MTSRDRASTEQTSIWFALVVAALLLLSGPTARGQQPTLADVVGADGTADSTAARGAEAAGSRGSTDAAADPEPGEEQPAPGGTPRSTIKLFLDAVADRDYPEASQWLDVSRSPGADAATLARQLEVVLDKKLWIDLEQVSDSASGKADDGLPASRDRIGKIPLGDDGQNEVPILLERVRTDEGLRWKFATSTVARIPSLYEVHGYGRLGAWLPSVFFEVRILDVELWQWLGLLLLVLAAAIVSWLLSSLVVSLVRLLMRQSPERTDAVHLLGGPLRLALGVAVFSAAKHLLGLTLAVQAVIGACESVLLVVAVTWGLLRLVNVLSDLVETHLRRVNQPSAVSLLPPGRKTVKAIIIGLAVVAALDSLGFDTTAVLAGLGVGGIAIALAAQKTVENLFGGASLLADRPVRVGDFCRFGDKIGTVEEIGLRSTRVRTLDRTLISVPNSEFATLQLENFAARDRIWYHPRIGLRYETTPDQIRHILVEIRSMLYAHPKVNPDPARIRFVGFGAYSLDLDIFAYVDVQDYGEFLEIAEDLNLRIMDIVAAAGSGFAFPSQTTYLEKGEGLDPERARSAEEAVGRWREERALFLPRFPEQRIAELRGTLDYPPKGSPAAQGGGDGG